MTGDAEMGSQNDGSEAPWPYHVYRIITDTRRGKNSNPPNRFSRNKETPSHLSSPF